MILLGSILQNWQLIDRIPVLYFCYPFVFNAVVNKALATSGMIMARAYLNKILKGRASLSIEVIFQLIPGIDILLSRKFRRLVDFVFIHGHVYILLILNNPSSMDSIGAMRRFLKQQHRKYHKGKFDFLDFAFVGPIIIKDEPPQKIEFFEIASLVFRELNHLIPF